MLYVTTRGKNDVYTAARTLQMERGTDGGFFVPFRMPVLEKEEVKALVNNKATQNIADFLNMLFGTKLTDWDVEVSMGRFGLVTKDLGRKLIVAELWHNRDRKFDGFLRELGRQIHPDGDIFDKPADWVCMSIRIAVLFGIFTELMREGTASVYDPVNVAVCSGDFSQVMAVWYARKMGLPIGDIIIGCNENSAAWELISRGQMTTDSTVRSTVTPDCDHVVPAGVERLVQGACGYAEAMKLCWAMAEKQDYVPDEEAWEEIKQGMFAAVISQVRLDIAIPSVYRSMGYVLDPYAALAYGALSDYRSRTGDGSMTLLLSERSPLSEMDTMCRIMRVTPDELKSRVN